MNPDVRLLPLLQSFFTTRLIQQKQVSPHTISSYRDTFRLLLKFLSRKLRRTPSDLCLEHIDAPTIAAFLHELERESKISARTRNLRLSAVRSFFRHVAFEVPSQAANIQQVLAIPGKRYTRRLVDFLTRPEAEALLAAPNVTTPSGRRDHALILLALQTGLRLSELISLTREDFKFAGRGACASHWQRPERKVYAPCKAYCCSHEILADGALVRGERPVV
jgi:site-specific recombinase XerD